MLYRAPAGMLSSLVLVTDQHNRYTARPGVLDHNVDGVQRITRHLWRMCLAMLFACFSFFQGQAHVFPKAVQHSFILFVPTQYAIQLQLLGGIWIIQTLPAVMLGAYTRWFDGWALTIGWAVGMVVGTWMAIAAHLTPTYPLAIGDWTFPGYSALYTVVLNLAIAALLTPLLRSSRSGRPGTNDETTEHDYHPVPRGA